MFPVDAILADECHCLAERLYDRGDQKVAAELDEIGRLGLIGNDERTSANGIQKRHHTRNSLLPPPRNDSKSSARRDIGAPEYRRRNEALASGRMIDRQPFR